MNSTNLGEYKNRIQDSLVVNIYLILGFYSDFYDNSSDFQLELLDYLWDNVLSPIIFSRLYL